MLREFIAEEDFIDQAAVFCRRATEVVRCGDCRWFRTGNRCSFCEWWHRQVPRHGFCHHGARVDGER